MNPKGTLRNYFDHNNEYVKKHYANFAPLWQLAGLTGGVVGGLKGALEQDPYQQIDPGTRLMKVATGGLAGAGLGAAVGGGLPQLLKEVPEARVIADQVNDVTGVNVDPQQLPLSLKERIQQKRAAKRIVKPIKTNRYIQNAKDVISQGVEDVNQFVVNPLREAPANIRNAYESVALSPIDRQIQEQTRRAIQEEAGNLTQEAIRQGILRSPTATNAAEQARAVANEAIRQQTLNPIQQKIDPVVQATKAGVEGTKTIAQKAMQMDRSGKDWLNKRFGTSFQEENKYPANFGILLDKEKPYLTGATLGAIAGTGIGAVAGINQGINAVIESDQNQLNQIQSNPDPYARKQQWDIYDSDISRAGRALGNTTNTVGQTALNAGLGAAGVGLLGGAGLTAYTNIKNKKFNLVGQPQVSRGEALKILLRGNR